MTPACFRLALLKSLCASHSEAVSSPSAGQLRNASEQAEAAMSDGVPTEEELIALLDCEERAMSVVITNPALPDNPMIYVSEEFETQTGYSPEEALGYNCRFLQGPDTDPKAIEAIRRGLEQRVAFTVDILNYRKSGEPFMNRLRVRPLYDEDGTFMYFVGAQNPI